MSTANCWATNLGRNMYQLAFLASSLVLVILLVSESGVTQTVMLSGEVEKVNRKCS